MHRPDSSARPDASVAAAGATAAGGILTAVAVLTASGPLAFFGFERMAIISAGVVAALLGVAMLAVPARRRALLAAAAFVVSLIALGLVLHLGLGVLARGAPPPYLPILGALLGAAGSAVILHSATRSELSLDRAAILVGLAAAVLALGGTFGPWIVLGERLSLSGIDGIVGKLSLLLALVMAGGFGALVAGRTRRGGAVVLLATVGAGVILAVFALHTGGLLPRPAATGFGLYLTGLGSVLGGAVAGQGLARALGLPRPDAVAWVVGAFALLGIANLVLGFALVEQLEDLDVSVFSVRIGGVFLVAIAAGLAAGQTWAWLLAFPMAAAGLLIAVLNAVRAGDGRSIAVLVALLYANVLRALWASRGSVAGAPPPPPVSPTTDAPPPAPAPGPDVARSQPPPPVAETGLRELPEDRTWRSEAAFGEVLDPLNRRDYAAAAAAAERLAERLPDLDLAYTWWGKALTEQGDVTRAREVLRRGIERSRRKYLLCESLGEAAWRSGNLREAVRWWGRAVAGQQSVPERTGEVGPYLYLHYVAAGLGLDEVARRFVDRVDTMRAGQIRLEEPAAAGLRGLAARQGTDEMRAELRALAGRYLPREAPSSIPASPAPSPPSPAAAPPSPRPGATRRMGLLAVAGGVLLLVLGVVLGSILFGDDGRGRDSAEPADGATAAGPAVEPSAVAACLIERGHEVEEDPQPALGPGDPPTSVLSFTTDDETFVLLAVYSSVDAALDAASMLGEQSEGELGLVLANVIIVYVPPPASALRESVEGCVIAR